jgi:hypothetical protein
VTDGTGGPTTSDGRDHLVESPLHDAAEVRQRAGIAIAKGNTTVRLDAALALRLAEAHFSLRVEYDRLGDETSEALWALEAPPPTPGPTREQVAEAIGSAYGPLGAPPHLAGQANAAVDAVMALLSSPATVLWEGPVGQLAASLLGRKPSDRGWDPGTHVVVTREATDG